MPIIYEKNVAPKHITTIATRRSIFDYGE